MLEGRSVRVMICWREGLLERRYVRAGLLERLYVREEVYRTQTFIEKSLEPILTNLLCLFSYIDNPSYGNPDGMTEDIMKSDFELKQKRLHLAVLSTQVYLS